MYNIVIVDDEADLRNGIANYFPWNGLGFEVAGLASDGAQALEIIQATSVDIVLTDIMMPNMDGIELAKRIYHDYSSIKVLFLSGYQEFAYAQSAIEYNVSHYIVKPTKYSQLEHVFSKIKLELDKDKQAAMDIGQPDAEWTDKGPNTYYSKLIDKIKAYIRSNYKDVTLESTAAHVHLNPYYVSNLFKLHTGVKFSDYVAQVKMQKAAQFLSDIHMKIYDVSVEVGYSNPNNFARAFKAFFHMTPKEFRSDRP